MQPYINYTAVLAYQQAVKSLKEENEKLKAENTNLKESGLGKSLNAEDHFAYAKYYFGFAWNERIENEFNSTRGTPLREFYARRIKEMTERCKDLEDQLAQKEKEPMDNKELCKQIEVVMHDKIHAINEKLRFLIEHYINQNDDEDNHNDRYDELLTRVQHFYENIKDCARHCTNHHEEFAYQHLIEEMEKHFSDFLYIPEN